MDREGKRGTLREGQGDEMRDVEVGVEGERDLQREGVESDLDENPTPMHGH